MIGLPAGTKIWLAAGVTDMRAGMNGLAAKAQTALAEDPFSGDVLLFRGRRGDMVKVLSPVLRRRRAAAWICVLASRAQPSGRVCVPPAQGCADRTRSQPRSSAQTSPVSTYRQLG
jgi:transposase